MKETEMIPLKDYLNALEEDEVELTFSQVEEILGCRRLNDSAYQYPAWWSNGGQPHSQAWMKVGFKTKKVKIPEQKVTFYRVSASEMYGDSRQRRPAMEKKTPPSPGEKQKVSGENRGNAPAEVKVRGYRFQFVQTLIPECENGRIRKFYPQKRYDNRDHLPLNAYGSGAFCRFTIEAEAVPGVYLWISQGKILYIGETVNLQQRFNMGYGNISPRNCYANGQVTNCKMNKVVMEYFQKGHPIQLYFYETADHKNTELDLLNRIYTKYNVKDNRNRNFRTWRASMIDWNQNGRMDPVDVGIHMAAESAWEEEDSASQEPEEKRSVSETFRMIWQLLLDLVRR